MSVRRIRVVAALLARGDAVLVARRPAGSARGMLWEFPGGKIEPGETEQQALVRECREELGIEVEALAEAARTTHRYPDLEVELALWRCRLVSGEPQPLHASAVRFATIEELGELEFSDADRPFVAALRDGRLAGQV